MSGRLTSLDSSYVPTTERARQRREYVARSWARERGRVSGFRKRGYGRQDEAGKDGEKESNSQSHTTRSGSIPTSKDATAKPATDQPPAYEQVPPMSPMPLPVVEEPCCERGSRNGKEPIILGMPSGSTDELRPTAPLVPTPFLDVQSLCTSSLSAMSSMHEQNR